ncbi:UPF0029-domain-containing protein [Nadsonia fulvescens var. elongata DSM 6958]|uniref:UPF0029-domain-containing protein n=1 Tax=Nadsonia fulvescens var. elongata DSM 6958 TaxID=857566 RepID=A0A1E3PHK7_9ASCO|nr:UPF0029-domain-containing protein [Nadsonia fulvescens var. elongata DSM 6958]
MSSEICDRKSLFIGRACSVTDIEQAKYNLSQLKVDKRVSKASHNITAWRITSSGHEIIQNFDDNGEAPGGEKILKLLTLVNISNVMVVVTRWYGGIQLGNDRFKHINTCAQEALMNGGFMVKKKRAHKKSRK